VPPEARTAEPAPPAGASDGWPEGFARGKPNRSALLVLSALRGLTPRRFLEVARRERTAVRTLAAITRGVAGSENDRRVAEGLDPRHLAERLRDCGSRLVAVGDPEYPEELGDLADPPAALFVRGRPLADLAPRVAVVGARNASPLGREVARSLGSGLAGARVCVVSGAARGIDAEAHQGALARDGPTIAVLGCGIDRAYPARHAKLLDDVARVGAIVSEYPPGVPAEPHRFPARNRIVAAMSIGVVVVEGAEGSGSMISADHALDLGRPVFAVPGPVTSPLAAAPLELIRDGATPIRHVDDLLHDLGLRPLAERGSTEGVYRSFPSGHGGAVVEDRWGDLSPLERAVLAALGGAMLPEQIAGSVRRTMTEVVPVLLGLVMRGLVREVGGRYEIRA
jgi:DNA processing protein